MKKSILTLGVLLSFAAVAQKKKDTAAGKCPVMHEAPASSATTTPPVSGTKNDDWWPNQLDLTVLRQNSELSDPMGDAFNYKQAFSSLDYYALKNDIKVLLTQSQDW
jgi:catalase-peroxidase